MFVYDAFNYTLTIRSPAHILDRLHSSACFHQYGVDSTLTSIYLERLYVVSFPLGYRWTTNSVYGHRSVVYFRDMLHYVHFERAHSIPAVTAGICCRFLFDQCLHIIALCYLCSLRLHVGSNTPTEKNKYQVLRS